MLVPGYIRVFLFSQILELHCALYNCLAMKAGVNIYFLIFSVLIFFILCNICLIFLLIHVPKFWSSYAFSANIQRACWCSGTPRAAEEKEVSILDFRAESEFVQSAGPNVRHLTCNPRPLLVNFSI